QGGVLDDAVGRTNVSPDHDDILDALFGQDRAGVPQDGHVVVDVGDLDVWGCLPGHLVDVALAGQARPQVDDLPDTLIDEVADHTPQARSVRAESGDDAGEFAGDS